MNAEKWTKLLRECESSQTRPDEERSRWSEWTGSIWFALAVVLLLPLAIPLLMELVDLLR